MYALASARTDTLSATLLKMRLHAVVSGATDAAGKWALESPGIPGFLLYLVVKGEGWVVLRSAQQRFHLRPGDCFLLTSGEPFLAGSDVSVKKRLSLDDAARLKKDGVVTINGGGESFTIAVLFEFDSHLPELLFRGLPPAIHIPEHLEEAGTLRFNIERFRAEYMGQNMGHLLVLDHLAPIILVQIFRMYLALNNTQQNWLTALSDPKLSRAIEAIHASPAEPWSLESLAHISGMSRAGFASNFKRRIGVTPGEYLTHWRMQAARDLLLDPDKSVASVANEVGYESESAFSTAFTRVVGSRPGVYRSGRV